LAFVCGGDFAVAVVVVDDVEDLVVVDDVEDLD